MMTTIETKTMQVDYNLPEIYERAQALGAKRVAITPHYDGVTRKWYEPKDARFFDLSIEEANRDWQRLPNQKVIDGFYFAFLNAAGDCVLEAKNL